MNSLLNLNVPSVAPLQGDVQVSPGGSPRIDSPPLRHHRRLSISGILLDNTGTLEQSAAASMVADGKNEYKALLRPQGSKALKGGEPSIDDKQLQQQQQQQKSQAGSTSNSFIAAYEAMLPIPKRRTRSRRRRSSIDVPTEADFSNDSMRLGDIIAEMAHTLPRTMLIIQQRYDACKAQIAHNTFAQQNHQVLVHMQRICQNLEKVKFVIKRELQKCPQDGIVSKQQMATFNSEPPDSLNEALSLILLSLYSIPTKFEELERAVRELLDADSERLLNKSRLLLIERCLTDTIEAFDQLSRETLHNTMPS